MKRTLLEEITRIHTLTYGVLSEDLLGKVMEVASTTGTTQNNADPKKADTVKDDLANFYETLEKAAAGEGITQQEKGSISFKNEVESMQIGLKLLGYELPNYGIDGLFGPETAAAVQKFTNDYVTSGGTKTQSGKTVNEAVNLTSAGGGSLIGYPRQGTHSAKGWPSRNAWDVAAPAGTDVYSISNGTVTGFVKGSGGLKKVGVKKIYGDQVKVQSSDGKPDVFYTHIESNVKKGDQVKEGDVIGKIMTLPGMASHVHVGLSSGNLADYVNGLTKATGGSTAASGGGSSLNMVKASREMLLKMIELLKLKNVTKEDIAKLSNASMKGLKGAVDLKGVAATDFEKMANIVIDNLEGGYYHPDMLADGRIKDSRYGASGETMMGMDRKTGGWETQGPDAREFWRLIDEAGARTNWKYGYMGGPLESKLRELVPKMMKPLFQRYMGSYMSEPARAIVMSDPGLTFNFVYAVWNGPGWFQRFARVINEKVASGITDPKELLNIAVETRKNWSSSNKASNSLIAQGGRKIEKIVSSMA